MGIGLWLAAGALAFTVSRFVRRGRDRRWATELGAALAAAFLFGTGATALDFGGWGEPDWRAGLFAFFGGVAAAGLVRLFRVRSHRDGRSPQEPSS